MIRGKLPLLVLACCATANADDFAIRDVTLEVGTGLVIQNATVVIKGETIASVSTNGQIPVGMATIDGKGKYLYPGFIDGATRRMLKNAPEVRTEGRPDYSSNVNPSLYVGSRKGITARWNTDGSVNIGKETAVYENGITTAHLVPNGGSIRGTSTLVNVVPESSTSIISKRTAMAFSFRNGSGSEYPSNLLGVFALLRQTLYDAKSVAEGAKLYSGDTPPDWMKDLENLKECVNGGMPAIFEVSSAKEITRAVAVAKEFGLLLALQGARDFWQVPEAKGLPVMITTEFLSEPAVPTTKLDDPNGAPVEYRAEAYKRWETQIMGLSNALNETNFAFSTGNSPEGFLSGIRKYLKYGLRRESALRAMTIGAAKLFSQEANYGSVEDGKKANLVLMNGDFAEEKSKVEQVWVLGKSVFASKGVSK